MDKEWIVPDADLGCDGAYFDYQELVRCGECKYRIVNENAGKKGYIDLEAMCRLDTGDIFELGRHAEDPDWFCADGKRKGGADDA